MTWNLIPMELLMSDPIVRLDRSKPHGIVYGVIEDGVHFHQDGLPFNAHGHLVAAKLTEEQRAKAENKARRRAKAAPGDDAAEPVKAASRGAPQIPGHTHGYSGSGTTGTENQSHTHTLSVAAYAASGGGQVSGNAFAFGNTVSTMSTESAAHNHNFSWSGITDAGSGGGAAHNNVQPTVMATKIIKR